MEKMTIEKYAQNVAHKPIEKMTNKEWIKAGILSGIYINPMLIPKSEYTNEVIHDCATAIKKAYEVCEFVVADYFNIIDYCYTANHRPKDNDDYHYIVFRIQKEAT